MDHRSILAVYAKPPLPGRAKSRLAASIGAAAAADLAAALLADLLATAVAMPELRVQLWRPPDTAAADFGAGLPPDLEPRLQQGADLGARMSHTVRSALEADGAARVLIVGSDCATHSAAALRQALAALERADLVFRPAADGGYVLIGARRWTAAPFAGIDWGGPRVMRQTRAALAAAGLAVRELAPTFDVDLARDLAPLRYALDRAAMPRTAAWLDRHPGAIT